MYMDGRGGVWCLPPPSATYLFTPLPRVSNPNEQVLLFMKENKDYGVLTPQVQAHVSMMAILGALTGQVIFGILGDQYGRRGTFLVTAGLTIVGNILQATAQVRALLRPNFV